MTLSTYSYNVRRSFHEQMTSHAAAIKTDLQAFLDDQGATPYSAITLPYYPQKNPDSFPCLRSWVYLRDEPNSRRRRLEDYIQSDIFIKSTDANLPDVRLIELIEGSLRNRLDLKTSRNGFYAYFPVLDYVTDPVTPRQIGNCRIESRGWRDAPDDDPLITRWLAEFKLFHR